MHLLPRWRFKLGRSFDFQLWSFGCVREIADLYSPVIFGPPQDLACACGHLSGRESVEHVCPRCGVAVVVDALQTRRVRLGHVQLACVCPHPFTPAGGERGHDGVVLIDAFPIAPVEFRTSLGAVSNLGRKYERLIEANRRVLETTRRDIPLPHAANDKAAAELCNALRSIVAPEGDIVVYGNAAEDTIYGCMIQQLALLSPNVDALVRSCGLLVELSAEL